MNGETSPVMVIIGGTGGIGSAVARRLAARAGRIALAGRKRGRIGEPAEVASAICRLLDRAQSWVTGQVLGMGGGPSSIQART